MSVRAESRLFVTSFVLWIIALILLIYEKVKTYTSQTIYAIRVGCIVIGVCTSVIAVTMIFIQGDTTVLKGITAGPFKFLIGVLDNTYGAFVVSGESQTEAKYCCVSKSDTTVSWRDCDRTCKSNPQNRFAYADTDSNGDLIDCSSDMSKEAYCDLSTLDLNTSQNTCNHDEHKGPLTCACCIPFDSTTEAKKNGWWDCDDNCMSKTNTKGLKVHSKLCTDEKTETFYCNSTTTTDNHETVEVTNDQSF